MALAVVDYRGDFASASIGRGFVVEVSWSRFRGRGCAARRWGDGVAALLPRSAAGRIISSDHLSLRRSFGTDLPKSNYCMYFKRSRAPADVLGSTVEKISWPESSPCFRSAMIYDELVAEDHVLGVDGAERRSHTRNSYGGL